MCCHVVMTYALSLKARQPILICVVPVTGKMVSACMQVLMLEPIWELQASTAGLIHCCKLLFSCVLSLITLLPSRMAYGACQWILTELLFILIQPANIKSWFQPTWSCKHGSTEDWEMELQNLLLSSCDDLLWFGNTCLSQADTTYANLKSSGFISHTVRILRRWVKTTFTSRNKHLSLTYPRTTGRLPNFTDLYLLTGGQEIAAVYNNQ